MINGKDNIRMGALESMYRSERQCSTQSTFCGLESSIIYTLKEIQWYSAKDQNVKMCDNACPVPTA